MKTPRLSLAVHPPAMEVEDAAKQTPTPLIALQRLAEQDVLVERKELHNNHLRRYRISGSSYYSQHETSEECRNANAKVHCTQSLPSVESLEERLYD